jgi:lipopolysaccharide/colanic/teichoic acid biosynthesis glycosyltransferase
MKRMFDLLIVLPSLVLLSPLFLSIAMCVKVTSPGPVFFRQRRVGWHGRIFEICKFRTMVVDAATHGPKVTAANDPRITPLGRLLRRTKLDELPQLINVLVGNMSLVGPRPQVPKFVQHYPEHVRAIVFAVRPGITDPAAIAYRHEEELLAYADDPERSYIDRILPHKLSLYVQYIRRQTLLTDLWIILQTFGCLVKPRRRPTPSVVSAAPKPLFHISEAIM